MSNTTCRWRYTNPPACDVTYAQHLGSSYDTGSYIYYAVTIIVWLYIIYETIRLVRARGIKFPLSVQSKLYLNCYVVAIAFAVRCADPVFWSAKLPLSVVVVAYESATSAVYSMILILVHDWIRIALFFTPGYRKYNASTDRLFTMLHLIVWIQFILFAQLQSITFWIYHACKLALGASVLFIVMSMQTILGFLIYRTLKINEEKLSLSAPAPTRQFPLTNHKSSVSLPPIDDQTSNAAATAAASTEEKQRNAAQGRLLRTNTQKKTTRITRILSLLFWAGVAEALAIAFQIFFVVRDIQDKPVYEQWKDVPQNFNDFFLEAIFDWIQAIATIVAAFFFRHKSVKDDSSRSDHEKSENSRSRSVSRRRTQREISKKGFVKSESADTSAADSNSNLV